MESSFALVGFAANSFSTRSQRRLRILPLKLSRTRCARARLLLGRRATKYREAV